MTVVRNNAATISRAIESVQAQTYPYVEHVILDGASIDGTLEVIRRYANVIDYFASEPDRGLYDALNKAIPLARGDLICVLNSDDWLEPDAAEIAVSRLKEHDAATILFTGANARSDEYAPEPHRVVQKWYPALVHPGCHFACALDCHNGIYATRSAYERSGSYDASYEIAADFKWIMDCLESDVEFVYTKEITVNYVLGGVSADAQKHGVECVRVMRERFPSLTTEEIGGLYHSFFLLPTIPSVPGKPVSRKAFLRQLLVRHSDDAELIEAIMWASLATYDHGDDNDTAATALEPPVEKLVKRALRNHPALFKAASRIRSRLGRRQR